MILDPALVIAVISGAWTGFQEYRYHKSIKPWMPSIEIDNKMADKLTRFLDDWEEKNKEKITGCQSAPAAAPLDPLVSTATQAATVQQSPGQTEG